MLKSILKILPLLILVISCNRVIQSPKSAAELTEQARRLRPGKLDSAIVLYKEAILLDSTYYEAYNNLGSAYLVKMQFDSAMTFLKEAIHLDSTKTIAYTNLANLFASRGEYYQAIDEIERVVRMKPDFSEAVFLLGMLKEKIGASDSARSLYHQSVAILDKRIARNDPHMLADQSNRAIALIFEGKETEGRTAINQILQEHPGDSSLVQQLRGFDREKYFKEIFPNYRQRN